MERLQRTATENLPAVDLDFTHGRFRIAGESSPTDAHGFYDPIIDRLRRHLMSCPDGGVRFAFELTYFNSGTARALMEIFDVIEEASACGARITVDWRYLREDDQMRYLGEEFADELTGVSFNLVAVDT